ncbi:hypothetical protein TSUD_421280, partial [Trifolium subterraneum]
PDPALKIVCCQISPVISFYFYCSFITISNKTSTGMATEEHNVAKAEEFKVLANEAFKVYFANRAFAHLRLEEYGSAILDATKAIEVDTKAIEVDPKYSKGYYRRGAAHLGLGKFKEALKDFQQ